MTDKSAPTEPAEQGKPQAILEKAIRKAIDNGWTVNDWIDCDDFEWNVEGSEYEGDESVFMHCTGMGEEFWFNLGNLMLDHDFAKALWGDKFINPEMRDDKGSKVIAMQQTAWRHHLRQMVVSDDPIEYLSQHGGII